MGRRSKGCAVCVPYFRIICENKHIVSIHLGCETSSLTRSVDTIKKNCFVDKEHGPIRF